MKRLIFTLTFLQIIVLASSQNVINGRVFDGLNKEPLEDVFIFSDQSSDISVITDSAGYFTIRLKKLPAEIAFVRAGYYDEKFRLAEKEIMLVYMEPTTWLNAVEISEAKTEIVAGTLNRSIFDFVLLGRYIILCDYGNSYNDSRLICLNENGDTLATKACELKPRHMYSDCEGNAYFQTKDSTYQILYTSRGLDFLKGRGNKEVLEHHSMCLEKDNMRYYYGKKAGGGGKFSNGKWVRTRHNDEVYYYSGDREKMSSEPFWAVYDIKSKKLKSEEYFFSSYWMADLGLQRSFSLALISDPQREFFFRVMLREIYAPLISIQDSIFIFDHPNGNIHKFNRNLEFVGKTPIRYSFTRDFKNYLTLDEVTNTIYLLFEKGSVSYLCELNPHTGIITKEIPFDFPFVSEVKIRDGWVYFIHRDQNRKEVRLLSRMRLPKKGI